MTVQVAILKEYHRLMALPPREREQAIEEYACVEAYLLKKKFPNVVDKGLYICVYLLDCSANERVIRRFSVEPIDPAKAIEVYI